jgi:hexokinase
MGSMADVPKDLLEQIETLEKLFTIDQPKLKEITSHFVEELEKGMSSSAQYFITNIALGLKIERSNVVSFSGQRSLDAS